MPQLDYHTFVPQLVWLAISFVVLYALMSRLALPKVKAVIEGRRHHLDDDLGRAAALKEEAEAAERQRQLAATLAEQIAAAEARIAAGKEQALGEIRGIAAEVGGAIVEKLTGAAPNAAAMAGAVGRALNGHAS